MNPQWQTFLSDKGAQFLDDGTIQTFGIGEIERYMIKHGPVMTSLSHQGLLKVSGKDAADFLQGQLTNDLSTLSETKAQLSAYCNPEGKVLAVFVVFKWQDAFYLSFDGTLKSSIQKRLQMFIMRAEVIMEDISDQLMQIGFGGEFADLDMQRLLSTKIKDVYEVCEIEHNEIRNTLAIKIPGPYHKYLIVGNLDSMQRCWDQLKNSAELTNSKHWQLIDIVSGFPQITQYTSGEFIAQFINLDKLDAINFQKGCFVGQEVIARMHYRGTVSKRMLRLRMDDNSALKSGDKFKLKDQNQRSLSFVCIQTMEDVLKGSLCLAVGNLKSLENAQGSLKTESGGTVEIEPLPYDLVEKT